LSGAMRQAKQVRAGGGRIITERRLYARHPFLGSEVFIFLDDRLRYRLRLKDLSEYGIAGLTDAPLDAGQQVIVQFEELFMPEAEVRWTRNAMVGMRFEKPLSQIRFDALLEKHAKGKPWSPAMRAGSPLDIWG
jgi:hypothetical protein